MSDLFLDVGVTISIQKPELDTIINTLDAMGYQVIGPRIQDHTLKLGPIAEMSELPYGYSTEETAGSYRLVQTGADNYFDITNGPQSWKQYFFPPVAEMATFKKENGDHVRWRTEPNIEKPPRYALLGVRPCDLHAIEIQDKVFMRDQWCDPMYKGRRTNAFVIAINCTNPAGTCFCASMGTGPTADGGYDLLITELDDNFLINIGSQAGRMILASGELDWTPASGFLLQSAQQKLKQAENMMGRELPNPEELPDVLLADLDNPRYEDVAGRCLSCGSCTQVCPTCFCWNVSDHPSLSGDESTRVRVWDSCFNIDYSYIHGGNMRPNNLSRYRQWLTHKFAGWYQQFDTSGCVGCGRCISWCPAEIDPTEEIAAIREVNIS